MKIIFNNYILTTPVSNVKECYVNNHYEGDSYRVVVKDIDKVIMAATVNGKLPITIKTPSRTIIEGENYDITPSMIFDIHNG
jgi:hypothetical protein